MSRILYFDQLAGQYGLFGTLIEKKLYLKHFLTFKQIVPASFNISR